MSTILHKNVSGTHSCVFAQKRVIAHEPVTTVHPDWCTTRHDVDPDGDHTGPFWPDTESLAGGGYHAVQIGTAGCSGHGVVVTLEAQNLLLTPEQARRAGLALLSAASWARDHAAATV
jgi:hypothetical protein